MISQKKTYVYRLMKATCTCAAKPGLNFWDSNRPAFEQNLNLKYDHGVYFHDEDSPLMNANDHKKDENINTMGRCTSPWNPRGAMLTNLLFAPLIPGAHLFSMALGQALRSQFGCICEPVTLVPWIYVDEDYCIDGAPALTIESELPCFWGGVIKIVAQREDADAANGSEAQSDDGQGGEGQSGEGQSGDGQGSEGNPADVDARELLPSEVREQINSFCDSEMSNPSSRADQEVANVPDTQVPEHPTTSDYVTPVSVTVIGGLEIDFNITSLPNVPLLDTRDFEPIVVPGLNNTNLVTVESRG